MAIKFLDKDKKMKKLLIALLIFFNVSAKAANPTEAQKIEMLITYVSNLKDATFIRNGSEYKAKDAVKFFRHKLDRHKNDVKTAKDFITKCASISTSSGKPYQIRFSNGKVMTTGEALTKELERIEKEGK